MSNSFGNLFKITTFGESHGPMIGAIVDGCPAGVPVEISDIQQMLDRRRPGQSRLSSQRKESDTVQIVSGLLDGITTGQPICLLIPNEDARPQDYIYLERAYRPSHADLTYEQRWGIHDIRGGGRSSARETASRVAGGAIANCFIRMLGIHVQAWASSIGNKSETVVPHCFRYDDDCCRLVQHPDVSVANSFAEEIERVRKVGDSIGGIVSCLISGLMPGLGAPLFDKLHARLAYAMMGIPATRGFEIGEGFAAAGMTGSEHNDPYQNTPDGIFPKTNHAGGVLGGISTGAPIYFKIAFKPVATIAREQETVNQQGQTISLTGRGRHDPCVVPRAVPVVEAMAALVIADAILSFRTVRAQDIITPGSLPKGKDHME